MKLEKEIPDEQIEALIREVMQNYPEVSSGMALQCSQWNYDLCYFVFEDEEDGKEYTVELSQLRHGFEILVKTALGMVPGERFCVEGWNPSDVFKTEPELWDDWMSDWDATVIDGLVQCAIFGEVIYG